MLTLSLFFAATQELSAKVAELEDELLRVEHERLEAQRAEQARAAAARITVTEPSRVGSGAGVVRLGAMPANPAAPTVVNVSLPPAPTSSSLSSAQTAAPMHSRTQLRQHHAGSPAPIGSATAAVQQALDYAAPSALREYADPFPSAGRRTSQTSEASATESQGSDEQHTSFDSVGSGAGSTGAGADTRGTMGLPAAVRAAARSAVVAGRVVTQERQLGDGKVERKYSDGTRIVTFRNGTEKELTRSGVTIVRFVNGDIKETDPTTQEVVYYYAEANTTHTTLPDGTEMFEFPTGQVLYRHDGCENAALEEQLPDSSSHLLVSLPFCADVAVAVAHGSCSAL